MFTYQIILLIISLLGIGLGIQRYRSDSFSTSVFTLWTIIWAVIIIITLFPSITIPFANLFGIGRGLDAVYIVSILFLFYIVFRLYNMVEKQKKRINELVSQLALKEHEK